MKRLALLLPLLAACSGTPPTPEQRAATDLNPSGRPYTGPTLRASFPPADPDVSNPILCHPEGPGLECARSGK